MQTFQQFLEESQSGRDPILKFVKGPKHDFTRIPGYCIYFRDLLKVWAEPKFVSSVITGKISFNPIAVPFEGNAGPPDSKVPAKDLRHILSAKNEREGRTRYNELGYKGSFERDVLRNRRSQYSADYLEIIINVPTLHKFVAAPQIEENNGYKIYNEDEIRSKLMKLTQTR